MHLIDTNIFLELLLNQEKKEIAKNILNRLEKGEIEAVISGFTLHSIEFILSIKKKNDVLKEFLQALQDFSNISVYQTTLEEDLEAYERKYGVLSETFFESYTSGEEPEDESWVMDWADWAGAYKILLRRKEQY